MLVMLFGGCEVFLVKPAFFLMRMTERQLQVSYLEILWPGGGLCGGECNFDLRD